MTDDSIRRISVGVSAEAVAGAWARQERAADGSVVVVEGEVAGRLRGGTPASGGPAIAVIVRRSLPLAAEDRLWIAAQMAATDAIALGANDAVVRAGWPDQIEIGGVPAVFVNVASQLGAGHIELVIVTLRLVDASLLPTAERFRDAVLVAVDRAIVGFDDLAAEYAERSALSQRNIRVLLLPRGETRGMVTGFDPDGRLRIETSTGMVELFAAASVRRIEVL